MSIGSIQSFLQGKGSGPANRSFILNCYGSDSKERQWYAAAGAPCDQSVPAADIIYYAAQIYGINPRVILATLQKEQSLITSPNPTDWQINQAMGYACPTSGQCGGNSTFFYQIDSGTWVLRYHFERARGNMNWWNPSSSWTCGTEKNYYKPNLYPGQNVRFYDQDGVHYRTYFIENAATSSLYCYTPHAYNNPQGLYGRAPFGTVGRYYSGSYNFVLFFEQWFGETRLPGAYQSSAGGDIYMTVEGYKMRVPHMAIMQDYGLSPSSVRIVSPEVVSAAPTAPGDSGVSNEIAHLVKSPSDTDSDGGSIYLISVGKRYKIASMAQFANFNFKESSIRYIPLTYINRFPSGGQLKNFIKTPNESVFEVVGAKKRLVFEYSTFINRNPAGTTSSLSYYLGDRIPSGQVLSNRAILFKPKGASLVYLYGTDENYYPINTYGTFICWGFDNQRLPVYSPAQNNYVQPISSETPLSCDVPGDDEEPPYIAAAGKKFTVPESLNISMSEPFNESIHELAEQILPSAGDMKSYVKSFGSSAIWYLENGSRRLIPSYNSFLRFVPDGKSFSTMDSSSLAKIPASNIKLADGVLVKTPESSAVYSISQNERILIPSSTLFEAYKNSWSSIETHSSASLNAAYPYQGNSLASHFYESNTDKVYLLDTTGCYELSGALLTDYGINKTTLSQDQNFGKSVAPNLNLASCGQSSQFVKSSTSAAVYRLENGQKRLITTWVALQTLAGTTNPRVVTLSSDYLGTFANGANL